MSLSKLSFGVLISTNGELLKKDILEHGSDFEYRECYTDTFSKMGYNSISIVIIIPNNNAYLTEKEIQNYLKLLIKTGFKFDCYQKKVKYKNVVEDGYAIHIKKGQNSGMSNLILLNAIRYIYESAFPNIVKLFIKLARSKSKLHLLNKFFIAHSTTNKFVVGFASGHSIAKQVNQTFKILSDQELKNIVFESQLKVSNTYSLPAKNVTVKLNIDNKLPGAIIKDYEKQYNSK